jgi:Cdc6-like AAA superfamily ATPase
MKTNNFVTVLTFTYPYEAEIIRGRLESEGIECFMQDELTVQVNPFYSNAIGGIKLQVRESDLERAIKILKEAGYIKEEDFKPSKMQVFIEKILSKFKK